MDGLMRAAKKSHRFVMAGILFERTARWSNFNMHTIYMWKEFCEVYLNYAVKYSGKKSNSADFTIHPFKTTDQYLLYEMYHFRVCLNCGKLGYLISSEVYNRLNNPWRHRIIEAFRKWMSHHTAQPATDGVKMGQKLWWCGPENTA